MQFLNESVVAEKSDEFYQVMMNDTGLTKKEVVQCLLNMIDKKIIEATDYDAEGNPTAWNLTEHGRQFVLEKGLHREEDGSGMYV